MFTGLIEETGRVVKASREGEGMALVVAASSVLDGTRRGDSISISGVCQTVTSMDKSSFGVFVSPVSLSLTTLGTMKPGSSVNLERAMTAASRMGGHMVQGHIDGTGRIASISRDSRGMDLSVQAPPHIMKYIVERGSIAVDGISLTVVKTVPGAFGLYLIPETIESTTARSWNTGDPVNLESDIIARYVEMVLSRMGGGGSGDETLMRKLREGGFA